MMESRARASGEQFSTLLEYMESHGDLAKPQPGAQGRLRSDRLWEELANTLNSVGGGVEKTTDKWKKQLINMKCCRRCLLHHHQGLDHCQSRRSGACHSFVYQSSAPAAAGSATGAGAARCSPTRVASPLPPVPTNPLPPVPTTPPPPPVLLLPIVDI